MALNLALVITGQASSNTVRLLANGVDVPIGVNGAYSAEVPVVNGVVSLTAIDAAGVEGVRSIQVITAGSVAG